MKRKGHKTKRNRLRRACGAFSGCFSNPENRPEQTRERTKSETNFDLSGRQGGRPEADTGAEGDDKFNFMAKRSAYKHQPHNYETKKDAGQGFETETLQVSEHDLHTECTNNKPPGFGAGVPCPVANEQPGQPTGHPESHISWKLFWSFLKIGTFTFGGGYAMIPLIQREVTDNRRWVAPEKFLDLLTLAQSAPGPISLNTAVFVGYSLNRYKGAVAAILGVIVPSFTILLFIAIYFTGIKDSPVVAAIFKGMRPAVVALIAAPLLGLTKGMGAYRIGIALLVAAAIWRLDISPVWFILAGIAGGIAWVYFRQKKGGRE